VVIDHGLGAKFAKNGDITMNGHLRLDWALAGGRLKAETDGMALYRHCINADYGG
jgi:hypothetical protein